MGRKGRDVTNSSIHHAVSPRLPGQILLRKPPFQPREFQQLVECSRIPCTGIAVIILIPDDLPRIVDGDLQPTEVVTVIVRNQGVNVPGSMIDVNIPDKSVNFPGFHTADRHLYDRIIIVIFKREIHLFLHDTMVLVNHPSYRMTYFYHSGCGGNLNGIELAAAHLSVFFCCVPVEQPATKAANSPNIQIDFILMSVH